MRFSIVIMTYKKFDDLPRNLKSIAMQNFNDYEIIISDDGSSQYDRGFIDECLAKEGLTEKAKVFHWTENVGTVKNYNHAISMADGEIIVPLSQDDAFYDEKVLEDLDAFYVDENIEACCCKRISKDNRVLPNSMEFDFIKETNLNITYRRFLYRNYICGATLYFKKRVWEQLGFFDENFRLLEDYPFILKLLSNKVMIHGFDRVCIVYGQDGVSAKRNQHAKASSILYMDGYRLYKETVVKQIKDLHTILAKRAYKYHWLISYYCNIDPQKWRIRKALTYVRFFDMALMHKLYCLKYGDEAEARIIQRILKNEPLAE